MRHEFSEIGERVYALLDENREILEERTEYGDPGTSLSGLVRLFAADAARIVCSSAPASLIEECRSLDEAGLEYLPRVVRTGDGRGLMGLPDGFLRLLHFRMSDWDYGVSTPLAFGGEEHMLRRGGSVRGGERRTRPAVAVLQRGSTRMLEIYGSSGYAAEMEWIEVPVVSEGGIEIPKGLFGALCDKLVEMIRLVLE